MNKQSKMFWKAIKVLSKYQTHLTIMKGTGIDEHQFRFDGNSALSEYYELSFLTISELSKHIHEEVNEARNGLKHPNNFMNMFTKNENKQIIKHAFKKLKKFVPKVKDKKDIIIVTSPFHYRLLRSSDLPLIKKILVMCISDNDTVAGDVQLLLNSKISGYQINQKSGVSQSTISQLRQHKRQISNLSFGTIVKLLDYAEQSQLSENITKSCRKAQSKLFHDVQKY